MSFPEKRKIKWNIFFVTERREGLVGDLRLVLNARLPAWARYQSHLMIWSLMGKIGFALDGPQNRTTKHHAPT